MGEAGLTTGLKLTVFLIIGVTGPWGAVTFKVTFAVWVAVLDVMVMVPWHVVPAASPVWSTETVNVVLA